METNTHNCPDCGKTVSNNISKCPHCGAIRKSAKPAKKKEPWLLIGCMIALGALTIPFYVISAIASHFPAKKSKPAKTSSVPTDPKANRKIEAYVAVTQFVTKQLKAPTTAKWPSTFLDFSISEHTKYLGDGIYLINGYVDSQNGFGAMVRTNFICKVKCTDNDDWAVLDLKIK